MNKQINPTIQRVAYHSDEEILAFLHSKPMAVISTTHKDSGNPEAALVAFCETSKFEFVFQTFNDTRKYKNLKVNPSVAFVVGWDIEKEKQITFQYEGDAKELKGKEYRKYRKIFKAKNTPCKSEWLDHPKSTMFIVNPKWFGYSNYTKDKPSITERHY